MSRETTNPARRLKLLALALLLATFVAGTLVGAALDRHHFGGGGDRGGPSRGPSPESMFAPDGPLGKRLELTPAQRDTIARIVRRDRARADSLFREMRPRLRARFDSTTAAVEAVLTPGQRREFREFREERRREHRRRGGGRGDGPGPGAPPPS